MSAALLNACDTNVFKPMCSNQCEHHDVQFLFWYWNCGAGPGDWTVPRHRGKRSKHNDKVMDEKPGSSTIGQRRESLLVLTALAANTLFTDTAVALQADWPTEAAAPARKRLVIESPCECKRRENDLQSRIFATDKRRSTVEITPLGRCMSANISNSPGL